LQKRGGKIQLPPTTLAERKTWQPDPNTGNYAVAGAVVYAVVGVLGIVLLVTRWYFEGYAHQFEVKWKALGVRDGRGVRDTSTKRIEVNQRSL